MGAAGSLSSYEEGFRAYREDIGHYLSSSSALHSPNEYLNPRSMQNKGRLC